MVKTKIAVVSTSFPLRSDDFSGVFVAELVSHLPESVDWQVVTPCGVEQTSSTGRLSGRVRCFRYAPSGWQRLAQGPGGLPAALSQPVNLLLLPPFLLAMFIASLRAARQVDVLHANWSPVGFLAGLAARSAGISCITTLRGSDIDLAERREVFRWALRACAALNQRLVCVGSSAAMRAARLLHVDASELAVIPNGIAPAFFVVPQAAPANPELRVLALGSLVRVKGLDTVIQALALMPARCRLSLVGTGPEQDRLASLATDLGVNGRVRFVGARSPAEIPSLMAEHDVLVLASRAEGRPNAVLEAMAAGRAVVASDISAVREILRDGVTGLLFPVGDAAALAQQLKQLSTDPNLRARLGEAARQSVLRLTWRSAALRYADLYAEVVGVAP